MILGLTQQACLGRETPLFNSSSLVSVDRLLFYSDPDSDSRKILEEYGIFHFHFLFLIFFFLRCGLQINAYCRLMVRVDVIVVKQERC